jgi:hypothetical protein
LESGAGDEESENEDSETNGGIEEDHMERDSDLITPTSFNFEESSETHVYLTTDQKRGIHISPFKKGAPIFPMVQVSLSTQKNFQLGLQLQL